MRSIRSKPRPVHWAEYAVFVCGLVLLAGCASLRPDYEMPGVTVSYVKPVPAEGLTLRFELGLRVTNPNDIPLELEGASYSVSLDDYKILTGVSNNLPTIDGYGEAEIIIKAQAGLVDSMQFARSLTTRPRDSFRYELSVKLSTGNFFAPIHVTDSGTLSFQL
ncbi:MAG: LEA type 2 family protein [Gammaproteobacteria bacterium]|nr:LEA type 2 family protein [Gammaproteobacteria bacterium]MDP7270737.1 LEA type 2 family protein [Gammaproteobacteria bacterium]HJP03545.1 LEA type 2 family protein [Gammaproteobacteria bacterium]